MTASFRGRPVHRIAKEDTFYQKKKEQNSTISFTQELLRALFRSLHEHADCYETHRRDLQLFFEEKERVDIAAKYLAEEKESS